MKALVLAAGYGTRLYPLIKDTPKALLPVNNRPLVDYVLDKLEYLPELSHILVVTNNKFCKAFENWAQEHAEFPVKIKIVNDHTNSPEDRLGSIGDIHFVIQREKIAEDLLVIGSDNLFDAGLEDFLRFARKNHPYATIGLYDIGDKAKARIFGVVCVDGAHQVTSFEEKPAEPKSSLIGMCLYYYPKGSLNLIGRYLKDSRKADKAGDFIVWLYQKEPVYGFKFPGKWYDIGSVESYAEASEKFNN